MKKSFIQIFALLILLGSWSCNAKTKKNEVSAAVSDKVEVYYFHFTGRCVTCQAVESVAKASLQSFYGDKIPFSSVNLDEAYGKALAKKLGVAGQTLLIVKGETKINITNEGFMYARNNPDKFKSIIKEKIDPLVN